MTSQILLALFLFAVIASTTPGPNTLMLLASGANFGLQRSLPHMIGIVCGFPTLVLSIGMGLGALFEQVAWLRGALTLAATVYLIYLAWKIASAASAGRTSGIATVHQIWSSFSPSIRAASMKSSGTVSKNCFIRNVPNAVISPGNMIPQ